MNTQRLTDTFLDLVRISSPSLHEAAVAAYVKERFETLGLNVAVDDAGAKTGGDTGNFIAQLPGTAPGHIIITAHMDTVDPCENITPLIREGVVYSDGTTVLGGDDKVGIAAALETVETLLEEGGAYPSVTCLFTIGEEIGLLGARNADPALFEEGVLALVCDGDTAPGSVEIASAHQYAFEFTFHGRAAHAGVAPEKGINAILMAADALNHMQLGRIDEDTVANAAEIVGGSASNVVPESCTLTGECRAISLERLEEVRAQIDGSAHEAAERFGGTVDAVWTKTVEGFSLAPDTPLVQLVLSAAEEAGLQTAYTKSCGATDANHYAAYGACPIVLGTGMTDFHAKTEHLALADLEGLCRHLVCICRRAVG